MFRIIVSLDIYFYCSDEYLYLTALSDVHGQPFLGGRRSQCKNKLASISVQAFMSCFSLERYLALTDTGFFNRFIFALGDIQFCRHDGLNIMPNVKDIDAFSGRLYLRPAILCDIYCITFLDATHCTGFHYVHRLYCRLGGSEGETRCPRCSTASALS